MPDSYTLTLNIEVHDPELLVRKAQEYVNDNNMFSGEEIETVGDALAILYRFEFEQLDCGFEVVDESVERVPDFMFLT